jgi:hypothetical protein
VTDRFGDSAKNHEFLGALAALIRAPERRTVGHDAANGRDRKAQAVRTEARPRFLGGGLASAIAARGLQIGCPSKIPGCGRWERARPVVSTRRGWKLPGGPFHASRAISRVSLRTYGARDSKAIAARTN